MSGISRCCDKFMASAINSVTLSASSVMGKHVSVWILATWANTHWTGKVKLVATCKKVSKCASSSLFGLFYDDGCVTAAAGTGPGILSCHGSDPSTLAQPVWLV